MSEEPKAPPESTFRQTTSMTSRRMKVDVPSVTVLQRDWLRIRRLVKDLANPIPWARDAVGICISLAAAFALGFLGWLPVYGTLSAAGQLRYSWIAPLLGVGAIAMAGFALLAFVMHRSVETKLRTTVDHVVREMDELHAPPSEDDKSRDEGFIRKLFSRKKAS